MNLGTVKWAQWDKTQSRELLVLFMCVCGSLCTIVAHNTAHNRPDNFPSCPPACKKLSDKRAGMVFCLEQGANDCIWSIWCHCHTISCFNQILNGLIFLVPAFLGRPGEEAIKAQFNLEQYIAPKVNIYDKWSYVSVIKLTMQIGYRRILTIKLLISRNVFFHGGGSSRPSSLFLYLCLFVDVYMVTKNGCIDNRKKNLLSSNMSSTCPHNMVNFGPLSAEIDPVVWGTPANFNGFRVLAALLHGI